MTDRIDHDRFDKTCFSPIEVYTPSQTTEMNEGLSRLMQNHQKPKEI